MELRGLRIVGLPAARWAVLAGNFMDARTAANLGLVTNLVDVTEVDNTISSLDSTGKPADKYLGKPANSDSKVAMFAESFYSDDNLISIWMVIVQKGSIQRTKMLQDK